MDKTAQVLSMESQQGTLQTTVRLKARAKALWNSDNSFSVQSKRETTPGLENIYLIFTYRQAVVFTGKKQNRFDCPAETNF